MSKSKFPSPVVLGCTGVASFLAYKLLQSKTSFSDTEPESKSKNENNNIPIIDPSQYQKILSCDAPAKVILTGEHAVVHGIRALATAINLRTDVCIYESISMNTAADQLILSLRLTHGRMQTEIDLYWNVIDVTQWLRRNLSMSNETMTVETIVSLLSDSADNPLCHPLIYERCHPIDDKMDTNQSQISLQSFNFNTLYCMFWLLYCQFILPLSDNNPTALWINVQSNIPMGAGLGSSAAFGTALSAAFLSYFNHNRNIKISDNLNAKELELIYDWAFATETIAHGQPSGIDNSVSMFGNFVNFSNRSNYECLQSSHLRCVSLLVIFTRVIGSTKTQVTNVSKLHRKYTHITKHIFKSMEEIGNSVLALLCDTDLSMEELTAQLKELFSLNHGLLLSLNIGHPLISKAAAIVGKYCGMKSSGLKITGAGGGGCLILPISTNDAHESLRNELEIMGFDTFIVETGQSGLSRKLYF